MNQSIRQVDYSPQWQTSPPTPRIESVDDLERFARGEVDSKQYSKTSGTSGTPYGGSSQNFSREAWLDPDDLGVELPSVPRFDLDLMPASLRPMVEDVSDRMQVPADFPAVVAVALLAGVTNRRALIRPKRNDTSWVVVANLWGGIVAGPGLMKSPVISCMTQPARQIEGEWRAANEEALKQFELDEERTKLDLAVWQESYKRAKKSGGEAPEKPTSILSEPIARRLLTQDATFESLQRLLAENPAGIFTVRDELPGWLAGLDRQGREQERAFWLECWSGDSSFTVDRISRGTVHVEHACLSLFGGIQPGPLRSYLGNALRDSSSNDGLFQRFQLLVWPDVRKGWKYIDRHPDAGALEMYSAVYKRIASMDSVNPCILRFSESAQELFVDWLTRLEKRIRQGEMGAVMEAHLSKYRKLMPALGLLFSIADGEIDEVSLHHAKLAADWCDYLEQHAARVYASQCSPERSAAIALGKRIQGGFKREDRAFTLRDVYRRHWTGLSTPDEARAALSELETNGWVRKATANDPSFGRPSETFEINPRIYNLTDKDKEDADVDE